MSLHILVVPDKFKGTLTAQAAAEAMARGWKRVRPRDTLELLPMSDGGDGFGEVISSLIGAVPKKLTTLDAAHQKIRATWWWEPKTKTAVIESAKIVGLAMLPRGKHHPFNLDTFGLGKVLQAAAEHGAKTCLIGIGGSATNDGGFGLARALGWKFLGLNGNEITVWTGLGALREIQPPQQRLFCEKLIVAVDVENTLLGPKGCSRIYGPQKGLRQEDFARAEKCLERLATVAQKQLRLSHARTPGAGAAGGLGFGLLTFAGAEPRAGFALFAKYADLSKHLHQANLVLTGEGALDEQTLMGKGVGRIALLCRKSKIPCYGFAGVVSHPQKAQKLFTQTHALTDVTDLHNAKTKPARYLEALVASIAMTSPNGEFIDDRPSAPNRRPGKPSSRIAATARKPRR